MCFQHRVLIVHGIPGGHAEWQWRGASYEGIPRRVLKEGAAEAQRRVEQ